MYGCGAESVQGDARFAQVLAKMGADLVYGPNYIRVSRQPDVQLVGVDEDCGDIPDVAMTLAVVGLFAKGSLSTPSVIRMSTPSADPLPCHSFHPVA